MWVTELRDGGEIMQGRDSAPRSFSLPVRGLDAPEFHAARTHRVWCRLWSDQLDGFDPWG